MTTIVTGAAGKFGRKATEQLLEHHHPAELILTTRNPPALAHLAARGAHVRYADFDKPETLAKAFEDGDRMLLISTLSVGRRAVQHGNAIEAAAKAGVKHIAYTSSGGTTIDNPALVVADHLATEKILERSGLAFTLLRNSLYAEVPLFEIGQRALEAGQWIGSAGEGKVGFVAKTDCISCATRVLTSRGHEGKTYEIAGPQLLSYREVTALITEATGKPIEYGVVSDEEMMAGLLAAGVPRHYEEGMDIPGIGTSSAEDIVSYERGIREGHFAVKSDDVQHILGRAPLSVRQVLQANKTSYRISR